MNRTFKFAFILLTTVITSSIAASDLYKTVQVPDISDLANDIEIMKKYKRPMIVEISADDCPYCRLIEESVLHPMILSGEYEDIVLLRKININGYSDITDFNGQQITHSDFADLYGVSLTPTVLFLDANGKEVAPRMLGVPNIDFYGAYVDINIELARKAIGAVN